MGTSYHRTLVLPVTGQRLVAWQVDLRRQPKPARKQSGEPLVLRVCRRGERGAGEASDASGIVELSFSADAWGRRTFFP
jgi:hypothetical protein